jgi:hypothetical protein
MLFLSNLRCNMLGAREGFDAKTGARVLRGKPRFELVDGKLELRNVPVPKEHLAPKGETKPIMTDAPDTFLSRQKTRLSALPGMSFVKKFTYFFVPREPFPEFRDQKSAEWKLLEGSSNASSKAREKLHSSSCQLSTKISAIPHVTSVPASVSELGTDSRYLCDRLAAAFSETRC